MADKVLIIDGVVSNRVVLKVKLETAGYLVLVAETAAVALRLARAEDPDLIVMEGTPPDRTGADLIADLRADPVTARAAIIVLACSSDPALRIAALRAGADDVLDKPMDEAILMARLRSLLRAQELPEGLAQDGASRAALGMAEMPAPFAGPGLIAIVSDNAEQAIRFRHALAPHLGDQMVHLGREALLVGHPEGTARPDIYLIAADLAGAGGGLRLMSEVFSRADTRHASVALIVQRGGSESVATAYDLGADEVVSPSQDPVETALRLRQLLRRKRAADHRRMALQDGLRMAVIDPLTGLHNRRYGLARLTAIAERARESKSDFAVMVIDLDRFKLVNDRHGHSAGDAVLAEVARRLQSNIRAGDLIARLGGEEFLVALPDCPAQEACQVAGRLRASIEAEPVSLPSGETYRLTISIGLALALDGAEVVADGIAIIERADRALLRAKAAGRNQVTISPRAA